MRTFTDRGGTRWYCMERVDLPITGVPEGHVNVRCACNAQAADMVLPRDWWYLSDGELLARIRQHLAGDTARPDAAAADVWPPQ